MQLVLGIDGGSTKTVFSLADENRTVATVVTPGCNMVRLGEARAGAALRQGLRQIMVAAGISPDRIAYTYAGIGGAASSAIAEKLRAIIAETIRGPVTVVGDMVIAHQAAFGAGPGVLVISGTGSIAYGRNLQGEIARAGGFGHEHSDEGSGYWVGSAAVQAALREDAPARHEVLLAAMAKAWRLEGRAELAKAAAANPGPEYSTLFPVVLAAATAGDEDACHTLKSAGILLAGLADSVIQELFSRAKTIPVAMCGGVFANAPQVRESFGDELYRFHPHAALDPTPADPVEGALELARAALG
jgi:N-acetylglucosamine kinase-like BadF-type ATPase